MTIFQLPEAPLHISKWKRPCAVVFDFSPRIRPWSIFLAYVCLKLLQRDKTPPPIFFPQYKGYLRVEGMAVNAASYTTVATRFTNPITRIPGEHGLNTHLRLSPVLSSSPSQYFKLRCNKSEEPECEDGNTVDWAFKPFETQVVFIHGLNHQAKIAVPRVTI